MFLIQMLIYLSISIGLIFPPGLEVSCPSPDDLMDMDVDFVKPKKRLLIIIDDNMYYRSMRYEYYQIAKKCKFGQYSL